MLQRHLTSVRKLQACQMFLVEKRRAAESVDQRPEVFANTERTMVWHTLSGPWAESADSISTPIRSSTEPVLSNTLLRSALERGGADVYAFGTEPRFEPVTPREHPRSKTIFSLDWRNRLPVSPALQLRQGDPTNEHQPDLSS